jgi:hypothetical protein
MPDTPDTRVGSRPASDRPTISMLARGLREEPSPRSIANSLQTALAIELATLPPYLTAYWSIRDLKSVPARMIRAIYRDEMFHLGRVCNLIAGLKEVHAAPRVVDSNPTYPGPLPGGVQPDLRIGLAALSTATTYTFMRIERPAFDPLARVTGIDAPVAIGEFYEAIKTALEASKPEFDVKRQLSAGDIEPFEDYKAAMAGIDWIVREGEGSVEDPRQPDQDNAHYYEFAAIHYGASLKKQDDGSWKFNGTPIPMPAVHPIGEVPPGGYAYDAQPPEVAKALREFDRTWTMLLDQLEKTWAGEVIDEEAFDLAVKAMKELASKAVTLMQAPRLEGDGKVFVGNYAPGFRILRV